jgi:DNA-binding CsgD family transcriptional regulator
VTASESERQNPLGVIDQLVAAMRAAGLVDPGLGGRATDGDVPERAGCDFFSRLQSLCQAICDFAETRPFTIGVDDVHFADDLSLTCLAYLIRRIESCPITVVLSENPCHEAKLRILHSETLHLAYCHRVGLVPLSIGGITGVLTERVGATLAREIAGLCAEASGGNPLLLHALIDDYAVRDAAPDEPEPGTWYRLAVLRCLHRCTPDLVAVVRAAAVLGDRATPSLIGELLRLDTTAVRRDIADLRAIGLFDGMGFRYTAARLAVLSDISSKDLSEMHGRAAELLHDSGAPATAVADQLLAAHDQTKAAWRVDMLREAARESMDAGEALGAVRYLRHAASLCADATQLAHITALLADAHWHLDPAMAARYLLNLSHDVRAGLLTGPDALVPVRLLLWQGDLAQANALLRVIDANPDRAGEQDTALVNGRAAATINRWWIAFCRTGLTREPGSRPNRFDTFSLWSSPLAALFHLPFPVDRADDEEWMEIADRIPRGLPDGSLGPALLSLLLLIHLDRPTDPARWPAQLLSHEWVGRVPMRQVLFAAVRSVAALRRGNLTEAAASARAAIDTIASQAWGVALGVPVAVLIWAALEARDLEAAAAHLDIPVPLTMFETPFALPYLQAAGRYYLAAGKPHTALAHFRLCGDLAGRWQLDVPDLSDWRADAAAALNAVGQAAQARRLLEEQPARLGDRRPRARGGVPRQSAATGDAPRRPALLRAAIEILDACCDRLDLARERADVAEEHARGADLVEAYVRGAGRGAAHDRGAHLVRAGEAERSAGSVSRGPAGNAGGVTPETWPGPADRRKPDTGEAKENRLAGLTNAERRVAALAVSGATNRQIAEMLFITVSTVEQHLTKIYRKLNVRRRSELPIELLRELR